LALERSCARRSDDTDARNRPDAFLDVESLLEPCRTIVVEEPADDRPIPADAVLMPPEAADDLDGDVARFEVEHSVAARPGRGCSAIAPMRRQATGGCPLLMGRDPLAAFCRTMAPLALDWN
jgi:hypothetical protein